MSKSTYELQLEAAELIANLEVAEGELTPQAELALDAWLAAADDKLGAILAVRERLKADQVLHKEYASRHQKRSKSIDSNLDRLNALALSLLGDVDHLGNAPKEKGLWGTCSMVRRKSLNIYAPSQLPADFMVTKTTTAPDKALLKKALATGDVPGAELVENTSVMWRVK
tara:strand:- start:33 stop:542 length:510 start_codon:yes stop_codon:yes gene_type:complete